LCTQEVYIDLGFSESDEKSSIISIKFNKAVLPYFKAPIKL
jgi:hypothetical protein